MAVDLRTTFADLADDVFDVVRAARYGTMTTVDRHGRPRSRVLITAWEVVDGRPVGWLATFPSRVKVAHLAHNPHVGMSYWNPAGDAAYLDSVATWIDDAATGRRVWDLYQRGSPPGVGYDPAAFWPAPEHPSFGVLRLDVWRAQVVRGWEIARGRPTRIWRSDGPQ